jgi:hypothetical protein
MKAFLFVLSFIVIFIIFQSYGDVWFMNLGGIQTLFSLTIALLFTMVGFGIADMLIPDTKEG